MGITDTTKDIKGNLLMMALGSGGIEVQESSGQRELISSCDLPTDCRDDETLKAWGFELGEPHANDPMFRTARLPDGWKKERTDHSMWSRIVDEKGRERVMVFYKAAFYDRSANMSASRRFGACADYAREVPDVGIVTDGGKEIWRSDPVDTTGIEKWNISSKARQAAVDWLNANRPGWSEPDAWEMP